MPDMDNKNAERLVQTYADMILRICYMYLKHTQDAEDICQDVLVKLLSGNPSFESDEHEKAWIIRTTINACKDHLRSNFWKRAIDLDNANEIEAPKEPDSELMEYVMQLPKNYRISIYLHYYEGYPVYEIASLLGRSENTVSAYLSRGRKRLKALLEKDADRKKDLKGEIRYVE